MLESCLLLLNTDTTNCFTIPNIIKGTFNKTILKTRVWSADQTAWDVIEFNNTNDDGCSFFFHTVVSLANIASDGARNSINAVLGLYPLA